MKFKNKKTWEVREFDYTQINSSLVSAQNRVRNYWVGKLQEDGTYAKVDIPQPEDKWILLKDVLLEYVEPKYELTESQKKTYERDFGSKGKILSEWAEKCPTLTASMGTWWWNVPAILDDYILSDDQIKIIDSWGWYERPLERVKWPEDKSDTLTTHCGKMSNGIKLVKTPCATQLGNSKNRWNSFWSDKAYTLRACNPNWVIESADPIKIRKLHPIECERLQTLEDWYTEGISDSQRYKALWNWWTVDVIAHIFRHLN